MSSVNDSVMSQKSVMESDLQFDFSNPKTAHDHVIVVEGAKFYVNSGILSVWSEKFGELFKKSPTKVKKLPLLEAASALIFAGPLRDFYKPKINVSKLEKVKEVKLVDICAEDFKNFLMVVYPLEFQVNGNKPLLSLIMDSPTEVLGFVSFNGMNSVPPVFQHLNIEEIKKIQNKVPLNWPDEVSIPIWNVSVKPMEKYLKDNHFLDSENEKEFSIICRSSALHKMFFKPAYKVVEFTIEKTGNIILIENIMNENDELDAEVAKSEIKYIAKAQLIKMPDGVNAQITVIEYISSIFASAKLEHFKSDLPKFLLNLTKLSFEDGIIVKKGREWEDQTNDKVELFFKHGDSDPTLLLETVQPPILNTRKRTSNFEPELAILGSIAAPLEYRRFLNTDFIKMEHFKKGFYKEFMVKPQKIMFYGTVEEYAEVLRFMSSEQLALTSRVVGTSC